MKIDLAEYLKAFFDEARDHLVVLESALLRLDAGTADATAVEEAFRAAHSMKAGADTVGLVHVAKYAHELEETLEKFRGGDRVPRRALDLLLEANDALARLVNVAQVGGHSSAGAAPSWPGPSRARKLAVKVTPHPDAMRNGLDPLAMLRALADLGTVEHVELHRDLPPLAELDPERCHLSWTVHLETERTDAELEDVFAFAPDMIRVEVARDGGAVPPGPPAPCFDSMERRLPVPDPVRFAAFLARRGAITAEQALATLDRQRGARPMVGAIAVQAGLLTVERLFEIIGKMEPGEGFGEAALRLGRLTSDQLGRLVVQQEHDTRPLSECLIEDGALTADALARELAAYRSEAAASPSPAASYCELSAVQLPPSPGATLLGANEAILPDFCSEADEHLEAIDRSLLIIDTRPTDAEALNAVYRAFHSVKGVASMLSLVAVQTLAHEAENLLNLAREGQVVLRGKVLDLVFASTDALKRQVRAVRKWTAERGRLEEDPTLPRLLAELRSAVGGPRAAHPPSPARAAVQPVLAERAEGAPTADAQPKLEAPQDAGPGPRRAADKETVRVDKGRLDKLINTIGELVIAQSMAQQEFDELALGQVSLLALEELSTISRDLQELSLSLRMVPLQGTFQKMTRLVRDLARKLNKPVELSLHGEETELDKTVVDQLGDPLMHMVRNAIDHGLEAPEARVAGGKPAEGHVTLRAYHQGGSVFIELSDDGRGLDRDRILAKAVEKGIVPEGARLSDAEVYALIFAPGFSTAAAVTDVSGRGVGMDVVRRNVEALQGHILIRTQLGKGTTFTIRLPLTLAIMDGLMVGLGDDVYVLPLLSVVESFRPTPSEIHTVAAHGEVVNVRGEVLPLLRLHHILKRPCREPDPCRGLVVLVEDQGAKHALLVDELLGQMQAVVKSLDANYQRIEGLAGATILGDGRVAMILDTHGLVQLHSQFGGRRPEPDFAPEIALGELV